MLLVICSILNGLHLRNFMMFPRFPFTVDSLPEYHIECFRGPGFLPAPCCPPSAPQPPHSAGESSTRCSIKGVAPERLPSMPHQHPSTAPRATSVSPTSNWASIQLAARRPLNLHTVRQPESFRGPGSISVTDASVVRN